MNERGPPHGSSRNVTRLPSSAQHAPGVAAIITVIRVATDAHTPPSAIGRLLDEISWEGNARKYRDGGIGKENVLTTEVFSALDFLPRTAFLGAVIGAASGADEARATVIEDIEVAAVEVLSGDIRPALPNGEPATWTIQPDGLISSGRSVCFIEAKRLRSASFQELQIARTALTVVDLAKERTAFALLVLADEPPVRVARHGRMTIPEALKLGLDHGVWADDGIDRVVTEHFAWITWEKLGETVRTAADHFTCGDPSIDGTVRRLAGEVHNALTRHA